MRLDHVCNTLGRAPMYGLTITNNIQTGYVNQGKEIFKFQRAEYKNAKVKPKKVKYLEAPAGEGDGDELVESDSHESAGSAHSRQSSPDSPPRPTLDPDSPEPGEVSRPGSAGAREPAKADSLDLRVMAVEVEDEEGNREQVVSPKAVAPTVPPGISIAAMDDVNREEEKKEELKQEEKKEDNKEENKEEAKPGADEAKEKEGDSAAADGAPQLEVPGKKRKKSEKPKPGMNETHHSAASGRRRGFGPKKDKEKDENEGKPEKTYKKHLFITSRVHPGES